MKIRPVYFLLGIIAILLLIFSPIIINYIVNNKPWFGIEVADNNDWIGFYGSYIGGLITLIALVVTIGYTTWQYKDQDRKRVQPYITIKKFQNTFLRKESNSIEEDIGVYAHLSEKKQVDTVIYFEELDLCGEVQNIGLGTAVNIALEGISLDNKKIEHGASKYHAIAVGDQVSFRIFLSEVAIETKFLSNEYIAIKKKENVPQIHMYFVILYDDMLGNTYTQKAKAKLHVLKSVGTANHLVASVHSMTYPTLKLDK
ncbi:hypothetical protein ABH916_001816 [Peribacillus frigoritolerans]|uniref:hypothetical protein n=1 Tax=Peribacillus frigoritolerans TaxID=450367 RepID=UPI003834F58A